MMCEWFKQLFGESEGKDGLGFILHPRFFQQTSTLSVSTSSRVSVIFETVVFFREPKQELL